MTFFGILSLFAAFLLVEIDPVAAAFFFVNGWLMILVALYLDSPARRTSR